jgi:hypothetical protein
MNAKQHITETAPGVIGITAAGGFTLSGFLSTATPILQALSLLIGIAVGIVTFVYWYRKLKE